MTDDILDTLKCGRPEYNEETRNYETIITKNERLAIKEIVRLRDETDEWEKSHNTLVKEIERLREENARLREKNELLMQALNEEKGFLNKYIDKIEYLREENTRLREALEPFAEAFESDYAEQEEDHWDLWESAAASILTYGHLRAAKAAILGKVKAEAACPEPDEAP